MIIIIIDYNRSNITQYINSSFSNLEENKTKIDSGMNQGESMDMNGMDMDELSNGMDDHLNNSNIGQMPQMQSHPIDMQGRIPKSEY